MLITAISVTFCLITSILAAPIPQPLAEPNSVKLVSHWRAREPVAEPEDDWRREAEPQRSDWRREAEPQHSDWRREAEAIPEAQRSSDWRARKAEDEPEPAVKANYSHWRARDTEAQKREAGDKEWRREAEHQERASNELVEREPQYNHPPGWRTGP